LIRYDAEASTGADDEWAGKIKHLQKIIQNSNKEVETAFQEKLIIIKREVTTQINDEIENKCVKLESQMTKKMNRQVDDLMDVMNDILEKMD
jgi:hypothetical protein